MEIRVFRPLAQANNLLLQFIVTVLRREKSKSFPLVVSVTYRKTLRSSINDHDIMSKLIIINDIFVCFVFLYIKYFVRACNC